MDIHLIMPFARFHLKEALESYIGPLNVILHPIISDHIKPEIIFGIKRVEPLYVKINCRGNSWGITAEKLNKWILTNSIVDEDLYGIINDDDIIEKNVIDALRNFDEEIIFISMERGQHVAPTQHPCHTLYAYPENIKPLCVSLQQYFVRGSILKTLTFSHEFAGDGIMAEYLANNYKVRYEPSLSLKMNYFEIGRWDNPDWRGAKPEIEKGSLIENFGDGQEFFYL